jgi:hypothetical protein
MGREVSIPCLMEWRLAKNRTSNGEELVSSLQAAFVEIRANTFKGKWHLLSIGLIISVIYIYKISLHVYTCIYT